MLRYAIAAAESVLPSTTYASSSFTRYRNGLSPTSPPEAFFPLTWPQMVSTGFPIIFFLIARFMSLNSADAGFSIFAAIEIFALFRMGSDASSIRSDTEAGGCSFLMRSVVLPDLAAASRLPDFAAVTDFACAAAGFFAIAVDFGGIGGLTAMLSKQPCG